jgi:iron-sulfur cluster protein
VYKATELTVGKRNKLFSKLNLQKFIKSSVSKRKISLQTAEKLWDEATNNFEKNGVSVFFASNGDDVKNYISGFLKNSKLIVKGKSLTTEEIRLRQFLENRKIETVETDLGEWIIQLNNELPSHFTAPAIHLSKEEVANIINKKLKVHLSAEPEEITKFVRVYLREKFKSADIGIIGANFVIANPGIIMAVSNEGNVSLNGRLPEKVFVITGYDRIYNNIKGMESLQCLLTASATGQEYTSYTDFIKKPLPHQEVHLIVLDNGRRELLKSEYSAVARCIRCASCLNVCPVYGEVGGHVFGEVYHGGIGSLLTHFFSDKKTAEKIASYCLRCSTCHQVCPMEIPVSDLVAKLSKNHKIPFYIKVPLKMMKKSTFDKHKQQKCNNAIFIGCAFRTPFLKNDKEEIISTAVEFFKDKGGVTVIDSGCCGMPHYFKGEVEKSAERKEALLKVLNKFENVFVPCSSGYMFLKDDLKEKLTLFSIEYATAFHDKLPRKKEAIYYHLPCHLKSEEGKKEFEILSTKIDFSKWESEKCCGSGGTYFLSHPAISKKILKRKDIAKKGNFKIITSCPSCIIQLRRIFKRQNVIHSVNIFKYLHSEKQF